MRLRLAPNRVAAAVLRFASLILGAALGSAAVAPASAQDAGIIARGDAVVTGFSGTRTDRDVPKTVHPLDRTFIDLDGISVRVIDLTDLGTPPAGQLADVPTKLEIKARDSGQVFGVAVDDATPPNAYAAATSMYGLQIVGKDGDGTENRLVDGGEGARWMPGQFGPDGGAGAIYRIDGKSGAISLFATIQHDGRDNAGPALGNITYDAEHKQLLVSDLETGLIHRLGLDGRDRGTFDHGSAGRQAQGLDPVPYDAAKRMDITKAAFNSEDPETWGYADARRRVFGLAVHDGRAYYAVAEGPSIWSVALNDDGSFGKDARIELEVRSASALLDITDIAFDGRGHMVLSQRGERLGSYDYTSFAKPQQAAVLRYRWDSKDGRWAEASDEYALGLKSDFHGTQGGVALSYGYDKFGKADYGTCRQTLWTTGEHLREGDDAKSVASGGPRTVAGLQGNYLSRVRPANAPPLETWFTDNDGRFDDESAFGHVGDVAIYAPCEPGIERAEAPPPLYIPPAIAPSLSIDKHCDAGAIGGKIRCSIIVTNVSGGALSEAAEIIDVTRVMFGPVAGTIVPIASFIAPFPGISCSPVPALDFSCAIPAGLLLPGDAIAIDVFVDTHDLALAGNLGFRNCATLHHPSGYAKACAEGGTDIVVEKFGPAECLAGGTCKFGLKIANAGLMPFAGDLLLADAMFVGGGVANAPVTAVNPPIPCTAGNTAQLPFTCVTPIALMPGEERMHWIEVTMPAPGGYWAENCFGALDPALLPGFPAVPPFAGGGGGAGNPSCVWVHVPVPQPNLKLSKTAQNGGLCSKVGNTLNCDYTIEVRNQDAVAFNGPITIEETMPGGGTITSVSAPWACAGGPPTYNCTQPGAVNIPAGGTVAFNVRISQSVVDSEANMCKVPNKAKITVPAGGAAPNVDPTDDEAEAQALTFGIFWVDPITGITFVMCDPTNLKVEKTAEGPCVEDGGDFACTYDVSITNTGPDPYKGPIKLEEKLGVTPTSVSFEGDLDCSGAGANFVCKKDEAVMPAGTALKVRVTAKVPDNGTCSAPNTATLVSPPENARGNTDGSDDSASATAEVPSRKCRSTPPPTNACPDGYPIPKSGRCPCPEGATWNRAEGICEPLDGDEPEGCTPGRNEIKLDSGRCVCDEGFIRNRKGRCVPDDGDDCGADAYLDKRTDECVPYDDDEPECGPREYMTSNGRCVCRPGLWRVAGLCTPLIPVPLPPIIRDCPKGFEGIYPNCRRIHRKCPDGYTGIYPYCRIILPDPPKACGPNAYPIGKRCECKPGYARLGTNACVLIDRPHKCPSGQTGKWPNCKPSGTLPPVIKPCPAGTTGKWPNCRQITHPPKLPPIVKKCPDGTFGRWPNCKQIVKPPLKVQRPKFNPPKLQLNPKHKNDNPKLKLPQQNNGGVQKKQKFNFTPNQMNKF